MKKSGVDYPKVNVRKNYSAEDVENAIKDIQDGMTLADASRYHRIPSSSLGDQLKARGIVYGKGNSSKKRTRSDSEQTESLMDGGPSVEPAFESAIDDVKNGETSILSK